MINKIDKPIWKSKQMSDESVAMIFEEHQEISCPLMLDATEIISVKNARLTKEYIQGIDYALKDGRLYWLMNSSIPIFTHEELYPLEFNEKKSLGCKGGGYLLFDEGHFIHDKQLAVTYLAKNDWKGPIPRYKGEILKKTCKQLQQKQSLNVVLYGDSIAVGANLSSLSNVPPYMDTWGQQFCNNLQIQYGADVHFYNPSVCGVTSEWGTLNIHHVLAKDPDLVIIAFGMNDGTAGFSPEKFTSNIRKIMEDIRVKKQDVEFILVSSILPNPEAAEKDGNWLFLNMQTSYKAALQSLEDDGIAFVDMMSIFEYLLTKKRYLDMTGNNINHPNDYLAKVYAQVITSALVEF